MVLARVMTVIRTPLRTAGAQMLPVFLYRKRELYPHIAAALYESLHGEDSYISRKCSVCEK